MNPPDPTPSGDFHERRHFHLGMLTSMMDNLQKELMALRQDVEAIGNRQAEFDRKITLGRGAVLGLLAGVGAAVYGLKDLLAKLWAVLV